MRQLPARPQTIDMMFGLFAILLIIACTML